MSNPLLLPQALSVARVSLASFRQRWLRSLTTVIGSIGVIAVLVSVLSIAKGYDRVVRATGHADNVIVLMNGAGSELASTLSGEQVNLIRSSPLLARGAEGSPIASAEVFVTVKVARPGLQTGFNAPLRGVEPAAFDLRSVRIVEGRNFSPGRREIIVGRQAQKRFSGLDLGSTYRLGDSLWTVVGIFETGGVVESELWTDASMLQSAQQRGNFYQTVYAKLAKGASNRALENALQKDPRLKARVVRESEYYEDQAEALSRFVGTLGYVIALLMGLGATFAALNTSYASVSSRIREIATLKAIGFRDGTILSAVVIESFLLALLGGLIGGAAAWFLFDGYTTSTMLFSHNYTQVVFAFSVTPGLLAQAALFASVIGILGSLFPAWSVLRLSVTRALTEPR
jgi:putative ABC transport system permease protein